MTQHFGVLGTDHLASFVCQGLRTAGWDGEILVSPHNSRRAREFSNRFGAKVARSNLELVRDSETAMVSVRPQQFQPALRDLDWPRDTTLLSVMAGIRIEEIKSLVGNRVVIRAMPISAAEVGLSPTTLFPQHSEVQELLSFIGTTIPVHSEDAFEIATVNAAVYGWHFALIEELVQANIAAGLMEEQAREIVTSTLSAASAVAAQSELSAEQLLNSLATPGGITAEGLAKLKERNAFVSWSDAFDKVATRLRRSS